MFKLGCTSDKIWNLSELVKYLEANQNQTINIVIFPEAVCLKTIGVYKILDCFTFEQVNIHTYNPFEFHSAYNIIKKSNFWFNKQEVIDKSLHDWNLKKKFFCFYHRPTAARLGIAGYLKDKHSQDTLIHFSASLDDNNLIQFELDKLLKYNSRMITPAGKLIDRLPLLLSSDDRYTFDQGYHYNDPLTEFYRDILIDVVVESHVLGETFFPTEKTLRPMWLKKPFIVFGSKNFLEYLRQMGFRTFGDFWNEDYDGYEGRDRYNKILSLLDQLSKKNIQELETMYWDMQYTLEHNFKLLQEQSFSTKLNFID